MLHLFRRAPDWRKGLIHIWCSECGRDLDWAPRSFAASHPAPACARCRAVMNKAEVEAAERRRDIADLGRVTAEELYQLANGVPSLESRRAAVVDGEVLPR